MQTKPREIQVYSLNKLQSVYIESHEVNTQFRQVGLHNEYEGTNEHPVRVDIDGTYSDFAIPVGIMCLLCMRGQLQLDFKMIS